MSESAPVTPTAAGGRRRAATDRGRSGRSRGGRRLDPAVLLTVLLPVLALGLGLLVRTEVAPAAPSPAEEVPRAQALLVCPATGGGGEVRRAAASTGPDAPDPAGDDTGALSAAPIGRAPAGQDAADGGVAAVAGADPATATVLRATGAASAGLAGTSSARGGQDAAVCGEPVTSAWLTGLGAGAEHASTVVLSNPDTANAVAELTLLGPDGEVDAESVRSLVVEAGSTRLVDLAAAAPSRDDLSLLVDVSRGRLAVSALDDGDPGTGAAQPSEARIALAPVSRIAATRAARATTLLGLPRGASYDRTITIANPGDEQARVSVRVLGESGGFVPQGLDAVDVRPGTTRTVDLTEALAALPDGAADETLSGVRVESDVPVAAGLVSVAGSRRVHAVALDEAADAQLVVPAGLDADARTLWLVDSGDGGGAVRLQAWDEAGEQVQDGEVELLPGAGTAARLSARAARLRVTGPGTVAGGLAISVTAGPSALPLAPVRTSDLVPRVGTGGP